MAATSGDPVRELRKQLGDTLKPGNGEPSRVAAVRVELPQFDADDVVTWLLMCDNLPHDAGIRQQEIVFRKVLAQLPPEYFRIMKHFVVQQPLPADCFNRLKDCLRLRLVMAPTERLQKLEQLPDKLGDMKPSRFYGQLELLYPEEVDRPVVREMFLKPLPVPLLFSAVSGSRLIHSPKPPTWPMPISLCKPTPSLQTSQLRAPSTTHRPKAATSTQSHPLNRFFGSRRSSFAEAAGDPRLEDARLISLIGGVRSTAVTGRKHATDLAIAPSNRTGRETLLPTSSGGDCWQRLQLSLLFVRDITGRRFLIDSGSEVSILPAQRSLSLKPLSNAPTLRAANGTVINVFETSKHEMLDLGLGRKYSFKFIVAAVSYAILGADFLREHGLIPDLRVGRLRDRGTFLTAPCRRCRGNAASRVVHVRVEHDPQMTATDGPEFRYIRELPLFRSLAHTPDGFPAVTMPGVEQCTQTRGPPVFARPRRLMPAKMATAQREVDELLIVCQGILVLSNSQWSSPIHLVPKDKGNPLIILETELLVTGACVFIFTLIAEKLV